MFAKISRFFLIASLFAPLFVVKFSFFPFITGKAIFFRLAIELALFFFLLHVLHHLSKTGTRATEILQYLKQKLSHPLIIAASIFALAVTITALLSPHLISSFWSNFERGDGAFQIIHYVLFLILAVLLYPDLKSLHRLMVVQIVMSIPLSLYALGQLVTSESNPIILAHGARVSGTLGNPSYLAAYLLFTILFILYFLIVKREYIEKFTTYLLAIPAVAGLIIIFCSYGPQSPQNSEVTSFLGKFLLWYILIAGVLYGLSRIHKKLFQTIVLWTLLAGSLFILLRTGTRGAFLALIAGALVVLIINLFITKRRSLRPWLGAGIAIVVGLPILFFATHQAPIWKEIPVFNRLIDFNSATNDIKPRIWTWGSALSAVQDQPLVGWGAENFPDAFDRYYHPGHYGIESFFDRTHNIFLEYLIAGGLVVFLPWISLFVIYYLKLRRRPKDLWYSILFVMPIVYLIQGFFLFDTLPIYISLCVFLALFITTEHQSHTLPLLETRYEWRAPHVLTSILLIAGVGAMVWYTAYLPLKKNYSLVSALLLQNQLTESIAANQPLPNVSPEHVATLFTQTYEIPSPVGQEETIGMFQKFVIFIVDALAQNPAATSNPDVIARVRSFVELANSWYDDNTALFPGIKEMYLNGAINLRFGLAFKQPDLVERGKRLYAQALEISPTRLEVIRVMIEVARIEQDENTFRIFIDRARQLRPDIQWD